MRKVLFISLGCDKNLADSEEMLGMLVEHGYTIVNDETEADVAVVNTFWRWQSIRRQVL